MPPILENVISPFEEIVAFETLFGMNINNSYKEIMDLFRKYDLRPSILLEQRKDLFRVPELRNEVVQYLSSKRGFSVSIKGDFQHPQKLEEAKHPIELFYYKGNLSLLETRCVSVVGARKCSEEAKKRTIKLVAGLVQNGFTIVSGLATGVDTVAMTSAIRFKGDTIGVIGTPIDQYYPKENKPLQDLVADRYLLISQVPFYRYSKEHFKMKKFHFPRRNETMSALSEATIIVEASDTSGSLTQARACLKQGRKLFILNACFETSGITWPARFEKQGAIRVHELNDILNVLNG